MNVEKLIQAVEEAGRVLALRRQEEQTLEDERPALKAAIVSRLVTDGMSATAADKAASSAPSYITYRKRQSEAVMATQVAWAQYEAAKLRAQYAVNLAGVAEVAA